MSNVHVYADLLNGLSSLRHRKDLFSGRYDYATGYHIDFDYRQIYPCAYCPRRHYLNIELMVNTQYPLDLPLLTPFTVRRLTLGQMSYFSDQYVSIRRLAE